MHGYSEVKKFHCSKWGLLPATYVQDYSHNSSFCVFSLVWGKDFFIMAFPSNPLFKFYKRGRIHSPATRDDFHALSHPSRLIAFCPHRWLHRILCRSLKNGQLIFSCALECALRIPPAYTRGTWALSWTCTRALLLRLHFRISPVMDSFIFQWLMERVAWILLLHPPM